MGKGQKQNKHTTPTNLTRRRLFADACEHRDVCRHFYTQPGNIKITNVYCSSCYELLHREPHNHTTKLWLELSQRPENST